jgi:hypothetical protein
MNRLERPSVEVNLTEHCNLRCYNCDHASPLLPRRFASLETFQKDATALAPVFHSRELRLVGGEPLLHPELVGFMQAARSSGVADLLVLVTNGVLLHRMSEDAWDLIDVLRVSVYPGVERALSVEACATICAERGILFEADGKDGQFQRSLLNLRNDDDALVQKVFGACRMARDLACHTVHEGRFYRCSIAPFMRARLARLGVDFDNREEDGVALHDNPHLREELARCLSSERPLAACRYCLGTSAPWTSNFQMDPAAQRAWLAEDHRPLIEEVRQNFSSEFGATQRAEAP